MIMKVLTVHNFHRSGSASGDDQVFRHETTMLKKAGVEVLEYTMKNDDFDQGNGIDRIRSALSMFWSFKVYREISELCKKERPDVVHVHTFFPLLSPAVFAAAHQSGVKVVQTLHDTRYVCPNASSMCNGKLCNECVDGRYFRMVRKKCFKNSRLQSLVVATIFSIHRQLKTFYRNIDCYLYLNDTQKKLLVESGLEEKKLIKKYNSVPEPHPESTGRQLPKKYAVYCGRIGEEKGIRLLCEAWKSLETIPLVIMGDGPERKNLEIFLENNSQLPIQYLGFVPHSECQQIIKQASFVLLPSVCYEGCSMVVLEAFSLGKPVIATDIGFMHEAITEQGMDTTFPLGNITELRRQILKLWNNETICKKIGVQAAEEYRQKYSEEVDIKNLKKIYFDIQ